MFHVKHIIFAILIVGILLLTAAPAFADGGVPPRALEAADNAAQHLRYHWSGQTVAINHAVTVSRETHAPAWFIRRVRLAQIYHRRGNDRLATYHLFYAIHHQWQ
jgi:hypothetical protein